ncbi:MAG: DUF1525 domain-containing protein [Pseudomonadales bacterium]|nr:DUF1525 domain-containing protein [Pseudomonadales bacterium]
MNIFYLLVVSVFLFCSTASAREVYSIRVFQNDAVQVQNDARLSPGVLILVHNMDAKEHSEKKLTKLVKSRVTASTKKASPIDAYMTAFNDIQNGPQWSSIYQEIVASTEPEEKAVRYGIKKLPAVLFNDKSIVYGVYSLKEAIQIYENKRGYQ